MDNVSYLSAIKNIRDDLSDIDLVDFDIQFSELKKSPNVALILSLFLGFLGADRFYLNQIFLGLLKLLTVGGFGIWVVIDWFFIRDVTRIKNIKIAEEILEIKTILE